MVNMNKGRILICGGVVYGSLNEGEEVLPKEVMTIHPADWPEIPPPPIRQEPWRKGRKDARFKGRG
jgi:hypothetical protein